MVSSWRTALALVMAMAPMAAEAVTPYTPVTLPPGAVPGVGPGVITPDKTFGKEYSHSFDTDIGGVADPEQLIAWDGIGGTDTGIDYSGSRGAQFPREQEVDAIANRADALYRELTDDIAHLIFSHDDEIAVYTPGAAPTFVPGFVAPSAPVSLSNGNTIGGAGELSVEESGVYSGAPPELQYLWAPTTSINDMPTPRDVDGVEVWGPEPGDMADSDKYSLETDASTGGVSVWNYNLTSGVSTPYITHSSIVSAVTSLLGIVPDGAFNRHFEDGEAAINIDALMVRDIIDPDNDPDNEDTFDFDPTGSGVADEIIFSINQIVNPSDPTDPDGYYATGSELFVMSASPAGGPPTISFLKHGSHVWDHAYTIAAMGLTGIGPDQRGYIDINAIEAVGELVVPEPGSLMLLACAGLLGVRRRRV